LLVQDWQSVYDEGDVDLAYNSFIKIFLTLYNKNCPIQESEITSKRPSKPWVTRGLINACKKKNTLYKEFVKHRTEEKELKYKTYKNKLTVILRKCKKDYYSRLLENNKNNIKGTWNILNSVIRRKKTSTAFPKEFIDNGKIIKNMDEIVAGFFNGFFVNVGPNLANEIIPPQKSDDPQYPEQRNPATIFFERY